MLLAEQLTAPWRLGARDAGFVSGNFDRFASVVGCVSMVIYAIMEEILTPTTHCQPTLSSRGLASKGVCDISRPMVGAPLMGHIYRRYKYSGVCDDSFGCSFEMYTGVRQFYVLCGARCCVHLSVSPVCC